MGIPCKSVSTSLSIGTYGNGNFGHRLFSIHSFHYRSRATLQSITSGGGASYRVVVVGFLSMMMMMTLLAGRHQRLRTVEDVTGNGFDAVHRAVDQAAEICLSGLATARITKRKEMLT